MILTPAQVALYARQAGFVGSELETAIAIAHAESGFNTEAMGDKNLTEPGEKSVGLWQINYRPSRDANVSWRNPLTNLNPMRNAESAYIISAGGRSFYPWSTYVSGAYTAFLPEAKRAVAYINSGGLPMATPPTLTFYPTPSGHGYWIVAADGAVYAFGDAEYHGRLQWNAATAMWGAA